MSKKNRRADNNSSFSHFQVELVTGQLEGNVREMNVDMGTKEKKGTLEAVRRQIKLAKQIKTTLGYRT